jgi:hypothetical protein
MESPRFNFTLLDFAVLIAGMVGLWMVLFGELFSTVVLGFALLLIVGVVEAIARGGRGSRLRGGHAGRTG